MTATWVALDGCGNSNTCSQVVTVESTGLPVLICATNKTVNCDTNWTFDVPAAFDSCTGTNLPVWVLGTVSTNLGPCTQFVTRTWMVTNTAIPTPPPAARPSPSLARTAPPRRDQTVSGVPVPPGGTLVFTGTVTNTGNVTLIGVHGRQ